MALGIFVFAVMGLVGLIPVAVTTHRDAKISTVLSQIRQRLAAEVMLTDGASLAALSADLSKSPKLFDNEGRELGPAEKDKAIYRATIVLTNFTPPGSSVSSSSLQRVVFYAVQDPVGNLIGSAPASGSLLVSKAETAPSN